MTYIAHIAREPSIFEVLLELSAAQANCEWMARTSRNRVVRDAERNRAARSRASSVAGCSRYSVQSRAMCWTIFSLAAAPWRRHGPNGFLKNHPCRYCRLRSPGACADEVLANGNYGVIAHTRAPRFPVSDP